MWLALDREQAHRVIGLSALASTVPELDEDVARDALVDGRWRQGTFFEHFVHTIVPQAAHVTASRSHDLVEQPELGIAAIYGIESIRLDGAFQDSTFVCLAALG